MNGSTLFWVNVVLMGGIVLLWKRFQRTGQQPTSQIEGTKSNEVRNIILTVIVFAFVTAVVVGVIETRNCNGEGICSGISTIGLTFASLAISSLAVKWIKPMRSAVLLLSILHVLIFVEVAVAPSFII